MRTREEFEAALHPEPNTGCYLWALSLTHNGYGRIHWKGKTRRAHRVAWEFVNGEAPADLQVCHKCDTPACCNPDHLFLGTALDNQHDMIAKGRAHYAGGARGERHFKCKLSDAAVAEIRAIYAAGGITTRALAKQFGVGKSTIQSIVAFNHRKHPTRLASQPAGLTLQHSSEQKKEHEK